MDIDQHNELPPTRMEPEQRISMTLTQLDAALACLAQVMGGDGIMLDRFITDNGPRAKIELAHGKYIVSKQPNRMGS